MLPSEGSCTEVSHIELLYDAIVVLFTYGDSTRPASEDNQPPILPSTTIFISQIIGKPNQLLSEVVPSIRTNVNGITLSVESIIVALVGDRYANLP